jgi:hypothetical protein
MTSHSTLSGLPSQGEDMNTVLQELCRFYIQDFYLIFERDADLPISSASNTMYGLRKRRLAKWRNIRNRPVW